jgi:large subunit ribosomal protein L22
MEVQAITRYARISPQKANEVARLIHGMSASTALDTLRFIPRKAARLIRKTLQSAIANAQNNAKLDVNDLVIKSAEVGGGPVIKRFIAVARGSAHPLLKRTSHVRIVLTESGEGKNRKRGGSGKKTAVAKPTPAAGQTENVPATETS